MLDANEIPLELPRLIEQGRYYGVYPATVADNQDPTGQGQVQVRLPWSPDGVSARYEVWARLATMMGGGGRGSWFVPEKDDEVLIAFAGGNTRWPYVVGGLWNGKDAPPNTMDSDNNVKALVSRTGIRITMDDTAGAVTLTLETPQGQTVTLTDQAPEISLVDSNGNSIRMTATGIAITTGGSLEINAASMQATVGSLDVDSPVSTFSGVVNADTSIASTIVGASYTTGVGNIW